MADYTRHQKKIIERYYDHRDEIMLNKLSELVTDLMLADTTAKVDRLWKRVEQAMTNLKVHATVAQHILTQRDVQVLAKNLKSWLTEARKK